MKKTNGKKVTQYSIALDIVTNNGYSVTVLIPISKYSSALEYLSSFAISGNEQFNMNTFIDMFC